MGYWTEKIALHMRKVWLTPLGNLKDFRQDCQIQGFGARRWNFYYLLKKVGDFSAILKFWRISGIFHILYVNFTLKWFLYENFKLWYF